MCLCVCNFSGEMGGKVREEGKASPSVNVPLPIPGSLLSNARYLTSLSVPESS